MPIRIIKWVSGGLEAFWGLPIIGGSLIVLLGWAPLLFMLILHIVGLIFSSKEGKAKTGHILGILASTLGFIPIVGMAFHILAAIFLLIEAARDQ
ncbi:hypothetical protein ABC345_03070 [Shouchella sp. 1P09AA]|uniref:hypothetical protein n=1 Tax=unclassified Shouchella TaxID=2893065 RepID=UPI0039A1C21A